MRINGSPDGDPIATVGMELDMWITNHTQDNGNRIFFDAMVAPDNQVAHGDQEVGATAFGRTSASKNGYFSFGFILHFIRNTGVEVKSWWKGGQFAFRALGDWEAIYDASGATTRSGSALRLAAGQSIHLEASCQRGLRYAPWTPDGGDRLQYVVNAKPVFEIDSDGHGYRNGKLVF